jgi:hypothetical protein
MQFEVDGVAYQARNMDAFTQWDVLSLLMPLLSSGIVELLPLIDVVKERGLASLVDLPREELLARLPTVAREFAKIAPADRRFLISSCLSLCERKIPGQNMGWAPVWNGAAGRAMFDDINNDFWLMGRIAFGVLQHTPSFARFFPAAPWVSSAGGAFVNSIQ